MMAVIAEAVVGRTHFENKRSPETQLLYMHIVLLAFLSTATTAQATTSIQTEQSVQQIHGFVMYIVVT